MKEFFICLIIFAFIVPPFCSRAMLIGPPPSCNDYKSGTIQGSTYKLIGTPGYENGFLAPTCPMPLVEYLITPLVLIVFIPTIFFGQLGVIIMHLDGVRHVELFYFVFFTFAVIYWYILACIVSQVGIFLEGKA